MSEFRYPSGSEAKQDPNFTGEGKKPEVSYFGGVPYQTSLDSQFTQHLNFKANSDEKRPARKESYLPHDPPEF